MRTQLSDFNSVLNEVVELTQIFILADHPLKQNADIEKLLWVMLTKQLKIHVFILQEEPIGSLGKRILFPNSLLNNFGLQKPWEVAFRKHCNRRKC